MLIADAFVNALLEHDSFEIVVGRLDIERKAVHDAATVLSVDERKRANRFVFDRDRDRFVVARAKLRRLLAERLGVQPNSIRLEYGEHGKPTLACEYSKADLRFNMSHSDNVAVYAFSYGHEIGVDVEAVRELPDRDDLAAHCFSDRENSAYCRLNPQDKLDGFFNCWTRKEAFVKALGDGLNHPLNSFDVTFSPGEPAEILRIGKHTGRECGWKLFSFAPLPGFVGAVAVQSKT